MSYKQTKSMIKEILSNKEITESEESLYNYLCSITDMDYKSSLVFKRLANALKNDLLSLRVVTKLIFITSGYCFEDFQYTISSIYTYLGKDYVNNDLLNEIFNELDDGQYLNDYLNYSIYRNIMESTWMPILMPDFSYLNKIKDKHIKYIIRFIGSNKTLLLIKSEPRLDERVVKILLKEFLTSDLILDSVRDLLIERTPEIFKNPEYEYLLKAIRMEIALLK